MLNCKITSHKNLASIDHNNKNFMMKVTRCIMSRLFKLFASQKWLRALQLLSSNRRRLRHKIQKEFSANNSTSSSFNKRSEDDDPFTSIRNLLPAAIAYRAPTNVLKTIIDLNPNILSIPSSISSFMHPLPLQYACSIGASPKTIKTLLSIKDQDNPKQPMKLTKAVSTNLVLNDDENRTALHYAIQRLTSSCSEEPNSSCLLVDTLETSSTHHRTRSIIFDEKETILTISYLLEAYPDAVLHLDKYNQTPIDMLQEAKCSKQILSRSKQEQELVRIVCNIVRRTAVKVYKRRKEDWERQGRNDCSLVHRTTNCSLTKTSLCRMSIITRSSTSISSLEEDETQNKSIEDRDDKKRIYSRICTPIEKKDVHLHIVIFISVLYFLKYLVLL